MTDSENENKELDQYGVWVKASDSEPQAQDDSLPDFSFLDDTAQATPQADDMFKDDDIAKESVPESTPQPQAEEFVLDDFIAGSPSSDEEAFPDIAEESVPEEPDAEAEEAPQAQVSDSFEIPDGDIDLDSFFDSPSPSSDSASSAPDGEISLDDFMGGSGDSGDISLDSFLDPSEFGLETEAKEEEVTYDQPLDINLSFDDSVQQEEEEETDEATAALAPQTQDFEDLFDNIVDEGPKSEPAEKSPSSSASSIDSESEEIDLDAFGVGDIDTGFVKGPDSNKPKQAAVVDYDIAVETDDGDFAEPEAETEQEESSDDENVSIEVEQEASSVQRNGANDTDFGAPDDSFDVDSLLNSVDLEDSSAPKTEEESANEEATDQIPDTFDEEAASLTGDISETESETEPSEEDSPSLDDFSFEEPAPTAEAEKTLSDDSFSIEEEPAVTEETVAEDSFSIEEPAVTEETVAEDSFSIEEPAVTEETVAEDSFSIEEPTVTEETVAEDSFSIEEPTITEETVAEDSFSIEEPAVTEETVAEDTAAEDSLSIEETSAQEEEDEFSVSSPALEDNFDTSSERSAFIQQEEKEPSLDDFAFEEEKAEEDYSVSSPALEDNFDTPSEAAGIDTSDADEDLFGDSEETTESYDIPEFLPDENAAEKPQEDIMENEYDSTVEDIPTESKQEETVTREPQIDNSDILKSIASELASLKSEIAGLKDEFAGLRKNGVTEEPVQNKPMQEEVKSSGFFGDTDDGDDSITLSMEELSNVAQDATEKSTGFFGDSDDGDDSITLSMEELNNVAQDATEKSKGFFGDDDDGDDSIALNTDELSNIINSADITEENAPYEEVDDTEIEATKNLSMDFENETLEEPVFEEDESESLEINADEADSLPEEISVPKNDDDIFVESSSSDMLDDDAEEAVSGGTVEDIPEDENEEEFDEVAKVEYTSSEGLGGPIDIFENDEVQPMTEENFQYLEESDAGTGATEGAVEETAEEAEESEGAMNDEPAEGVFSQWEGEEETVPTVDEVTKAAPLTAAETVDQVAESATPEVEAKQSKGIPEEMKQEIKSVLSYMDQLLDSLPEEKITEFAKSEQFETYKKLFTELGLA